MLRFVCGECKPEWKESSIVSSIEFYDDETPFVHDGKIGAYCVGFRYAGGDPQDKESWSYDHANFWVDESNAAMEVPKDAVSAALSRYSLNIGDILEKFVNMLE